MIFSAVESLFSSLRVFRAQQQGLMCILNFSTVLLKWQPTRLKKRVLCKWNQKETRPLVPVHATTILLPFFPPDPGTKQNKTTLDLASQESLFTCSPTDICVLCAITSGHTWAMLAGLYRSRCCVNHSALLTTKWGRQAEQCHSLPGIWQERENKCIFDICSCSSL